jgi:hypothetical protein
MASGKNRSLSIAPNNVRPLVGKKGQITLTIPEFSTLSIPVTSNVICDIAYDTSDWTLNGTSMSVFVNGNEVANIVFRNEKGHKTNSVNLDGFLNNGINDVNCKCSVFDRVSPSTKGDFSITADGHLIVNKSYVTTEFGQAFDEHWSLDKR